MRLRHAVCLFLVLWAAAAMTAADVRAPNRPPADPGKTVTVQAQPFTGGSGREDSMWSALYAARSGKLYVGLRVHGPSLAPYR